MTMSKHIFSLICFLVLLSSSSQARPNIEAITQKFDSYVEKSYKKWDVPGLSVALIAEGKVVWMKAYGVRDANTKEPVTTDTVFQIGSISKSFTSSLVALAVDKKLINWSDRVIDRDPSFRTFDPWVTREFRVDDTMSQRSGQPAYASDQMVLMGAGRDDVLKAIAYVEPVSSFRSKFAYVNNLWLEAAKMLELTQAKTWEQLVKEQIFTPLKMTASTTDKNGLFNAPNHATPHQWSKSGPIALAPDWPFQHWVYTYGPAGGINSTIKDMTSYLLAQLGKIDLISAQSLEVLHSPHVFIGGGDNKKAPENFRDVGQVSYCLGWLRQQRSPYPIVWHNGGTSGFRSIAALVPEADIGMVMLSNIDSSDLGEALMNRYYDLYFELPEYDYSSAFLKDFHAQPEAPKRPQPARPPAALSAYAGVYTNPAYGRAKVQIKGDALELSLGKKFILTLKSWDGDIFSYQDPLSEEPSLSHLSFIANDQGEFNMLRIDSLKDVEGGVFKRVTEH